MKCEVTVKGENRDRFKRLSEKFGQVAALQAIYDNDGVASIEGFVSDTEIANRVSALSFMTLNELTQMAGGLPSLAQDESNTSKARIEKAIEATRDHVAKIVEDSINDYESGDKAEGAYIAVKSFVMLKNFDLLVPKVKARLKNFGLNLSNIENDLDYEVKSENNENDKEHIYGQGVTERSRLDSVPPQIKLYVATLAKSEYMDKNDRVSREPILDDIGMKQPVDFGEAYSMLSKTLTDVNSMEEMMNSLYDMGENLPYMMDIYEDLDSNLMEPDTQIKLKGKNVKNFKNAFFTSFRNTFSNFTTVAFRTKTNSETGDKAISAQVLNTNKRRLDNELKKGWIRDNRQYSRLSKTERESIWSRTDNEGDSMADFFNPKTQKGMIKKLDSLKNKEAIYQLSKHLKTTGLNVSLEALQNIRSKMNRGSKKLFGAKVMTDVNSYGNLVKGFWQGMGNNILVDENSTVVELAKAEAAVSNDKSGGSFMNGESNMVYPINLPTGATDLFNDMAGKTDRYHEFANDPMMGEFRIVKQFSKSKHGMEMATFDTVYNNDNASGTSFSSLDPLSSMATRMMLHMDYSARGKGNATKGWYMTPTPSDRSGTRIFKMPKLKNTGWSILGLQNGDFKDWLKDSVTGEFNRIQRVREEYAEAQKSGDKSKLIANYHTGKGGVLGNGGYFNYFPELNTLMEMEGDNFDPHSEEALQIVENATRQQVEADIDYLEEIGLLENVGKQYEEFRLSDFAKKIMPAGVVKAKQVYSFVANSIVANHELSTMFNGDLAHFMATNYVEGQSMKAQLSNANKRAGLADTPGQKLNIGEGGANPTFKTAFVRDVEFGSSLVNEYIEAIGKKQGGKYGNMESTDGQGLMSLDRYADIQAGLGQLTPSLAQTINELKKDNPDWSKVTEKIQPVKGFLQGQRYNPQFDRIMPHNLKYSLYPMIPSNFRDNSVMKEIGEKMSRDGIDELVFNTGSKYGAYNVNDVNAESYDSVDLSNEDWRMPQVVPYKTKTMENFGTQIRKLIVGNVNSEAAYGDKYGTQMLADYQAAISGNLKASFMGLVGKLSEGGKISTKKVAEQVAENISRNAYKTTPDFLEQALEVIEHEDGTFDTRIPMSFPALKHQVEGALNSAVRKAVTKQDLPGISAVQYTGLGYSEKNINTDKTLKFVRNDNGKILPAEIKVSPQYFIQSLLKKEQTPEVVEAIQKMKEGRIDLADFDSSLLEGVIYRIPTQGKNSTLPVKIVAFTPEAQGSTIAVAPEITIQSGADYDIDKVYLEMKHFDVVDGKMTTIENSLDTKEGRDNTIVNTHYDILTSPEHFAEMITPNNSDTLDAISSTMSELFSANEAGRKWSSMATQDDFRDKNQAGGVMIGVFSIANTAHSLFQELGVKLSNRGGEGGVVINGKEVTSLSLLNNQEGGLISDDHLENQTAAVDNASNPVLGNLNINTITGPAYNFLIEAGAGIKYSAYMVGSPIIRELTTEVRKFETISGKDSAFQQALKTVAEKYGIDTDIVNTQDVDVSMAELEAAATAENRNPAVDAEILQAFLTFRKYGNDLVFVQQALQTDNVGAHQTLAENYIHSEKLAKVVGTRAHAKRQAQYPNDTLETVSTIELNREKYSKHSMESFEAFGLEGAVGLVGSVIDDTKPVQQKVIKDFASNMNTLNPRDLRTLMNDFYSYIYLNKETGLNDTSAIADWLDSDTMADLLVGEESVGKSVLAMQGRETIKASEDITYTPNEFVMSLTVELDSAKNGYDLVKFNNTIARALSSEQKTTLSNELVRLFDTDPELAQDLVLYSLGMDGFNRHTESFGDFIHASIYENISDENGNNLVEFYRNSRSEFNNIENFSFEDFQNKFLRNRGAELKGLMDFSKRKRKDIREFLTENKHVKFFKTTHNNEIVVAESRQDGTGNFDLIGESLGIPNTQIEYQTGVPMVEVNSVEAAIKLKEASQDAETNGQC